MAMLKMQKKKTAEDEIRKQIEELRRQQDQMEERERAREAARRKQEKVKINWTKHNADRTPKTRKN